MQTTSSLLRSTKRAPLHFRVIEAVQGNLDAPLGKLLYDLQEQVASQMEEVVALERHILSREKVEAAIKHWESFLLKELNDPELDFSVGVYLGRTRCNVDVLDYIVSNSSRRMYLTEVRPFYLAIALRYNELIQEIHRLYSKKITPEAIGFTPPEDLLTWLREVDVAELANSFRWGDTPQGADFWCSLLLDRQDPERFRRQATNYLRVVCGVPDNSYLADEVLTSSNNITNATIRPQQIFGNLEEIIARG